MIEHTLEKFIIKPGCPDTIQACAVTMDRADLAGRVLDVFGAAVNKAKELLGSADLKLIQSLFSPFAVTFWVIRKGDLGDRLRNH